MVKELSKLGIKSEKRSGISPGIAEAVTLTDPKGTPIDLYAEYKFDEAAQPAYFNILKLGHVAYRVLDVQQIVKFYSEVLGFRVSDWRGDFFVFMRCNTDHHTLNFIIDEKPQLHHIAFEVLDWSEINKAGDWLARNKIHLVWGPGRHVIGHNVATYHRNSTIWCGSRSSPRWTRSRTRRSATSIRARGTRNSRSIRRCTGRRRCGTTGATAPSA